MSDQHPAWAWCFAILSLIARAFCKSGFFQPCRTVRVVRAVPDSHFVSRSDAIPRCGLQLLKNHLHITSKILETGLSRTAIGSSSYSGAVSANALLRA